jgi:hypothetical protein
MTSRVFLALVAGASILNGVLTSAGAQSTAGENTRAVPVAAPNVPNAAEHVAAATDSTRSYDARALRFESSWGNVRIIRGADGELVGTSGWFRNIELEKLVATSQTAVSQARLYEKNNFRGSLVGTVGAVTSVVGLMLTNSSNSAASPALIIGGVGAVVWGVQHINMSYSALSRALWWYNRDLPR